MIDQYSLKARIYPVIILFSPILIVGIFYSLEFKSLLHAGSALGLMGLLSYLFSQLGRDKGKNKERDLWTSWGGPPSTQLLRMSNDEIDRLTKERYHTKLSKICPLNAILDYGIEKTNPTASDEIYGAWTRFLITQTRDANKFPLILKENTSYGFRRNLWALKGFAISILSVLLVGVYFNSYREVNSFNPNDFAIIYWYSTSCLLAILFFWLFIVTPSWVKTPAFAYANRLFEAIDQI